MLKVQVRDICAVFLSLYLVKSAHISDSVIVSDPYDLYDVMDRFCVRY